MTTTSGEVVRGQGYTLGWVGAQRQVLAGDLTSRADLRRLAAVPHVNAVGPLAGLRGEVTLIDGVPLISIVSAGAVRVEELRARSVLPGARGGAGLEVAPAGALADKDHPVPGAFEELVGRRVGSRPIQGEITGSDPVQPLRARSTRMTIA